MNLDDIPINTTPRNHPPTEQHTTTGHCQACEPHPEDPGATRPV